MTKRVEKSQNFGHHGVSNETLSNFFAASTFTGICTGYKQSRCAALEVACPCVIFPQLSSFMIPGSGLGDRIWTKV